MFLSDLYPSVYAGLKRLAKRLCGIREIATCDDLTGGMSGAGRDADNRTGRAPEAAEGFLYEFTCHGFLRLLVSLN